MLAPTAKMTLPLSALALVAMGALSISRTAVASDAGSRAHVAGTAVGGHCKKNVTAQGTITFSDWQFPSTMNTYQGSQRVSVAAGDATSDHLYGIDGRGRYVPYMLAAYPTVKNGLISRDGKTVTVILKPGLRWSNGEPLTAPDEKFGWQVDRSRLTGPACLNSCDVIKRFDVVRPTTARLTLKHPAPTDQVLSYDIWPSGGWYSPAANGGYTRGDVKGAATWLEDPKTNFESSAYPTTGPYRIEEWDPGKRIVMVPNRYYADLTCGAYIKRLIFTAYDSKSAMEAAAAGHRTDMTQDYLPTDLPVLRQHQDAYRIWESPSPILEHLELNVFDLVVKGHPNALTNVKVRQALNLAIDKDTLIESALDIPTATAARAVEAWSPWLVTKRYTQQYADRRITGAWDPLAGGGHGAFVQPGTTQALADARKLLAQAGHPGGSDVIVDLESGAGSTVRLQQMNFLKQTWAQLGVTTNVIQSGSFPCTFSCPGDLAAGTFGAADFAWFVGPDPDALKFFFQSRYVARPGNRAAGNLQNYAGVADRLIDTDFSLASTAVSDAEKKKLYRAIQLRIAKQVYWIPLYWRPDLATTDSAFTGFKPGLGDDTWNIVDWKPVSG